VAGLTYLPTINGEEPIFYWHSEGCSLQANVYVKANSNSAWTCVGAIAGWSPLCTISVAGNCLLNMSFDYDDLVYHAPDPDDE